MIHVLEKEDRAWNRRASAKLNSWIKEYKKAKPVPHPFQIVGAGKTNRSRNDCISGKD